VKHPSIDELRLHVEEPSLGLEEHLASCEKCRGLLELARHEEMALRGAIPAEPPKGFLEKTLRSLDKPRSGRVPRPPRLGMPPYLWPLLLVMVAGVLWVIFGTTPPPPASPSAPAPPSVPVPVAVPVPVPGLPPVPVAVPVPVPEAPPAPETSETVVAENPPPPTAPAPPPAPEAPTPPSTQPQEKAEVLATLRSGKLTANGTAVAPGSTISVGSLVAVTACELESAGCVALKVPSGAHFSVATDEQDLVWTLEKGGLEARTLGERHYRIKTQDTVATPVGTSFVVWLEGGRTHVATAEGLVRVGTVDVRAGFEVEAVKGKPTSPHAIAKLPSWSKLKVSKVRLVRGFSFEADVEGWTTGELVPTGAHGSHGALRAVARDASEYAVAAEIEDMKKPVLETDPDLWIAATCKVDRRTKVVIQLWDLDAKENLAFFATLEPNEWEEISAPLRDFTDPAGKPRGRPVPKGDRGSCFTIFAGEKGSKLELLVDDVRFYFSD
jgi:hypothetical protein